MSNLAAELIEPKNMEIRDVPRPDPVPGGITVDLVFGGVCGSDVHPYTGQPGPCHSP
jgi:L-iditol 2-dehydrogenase